MISKKQEHIAIYRLTTEVYKSRDGFVFSKKIRKMKRLSKGYDALEEEWASIGCDMEPIIGIESAVDGLYEIKMVNASVDYETGYVDSYDLQMFPYQPTGIDHEHKK